MNGNEKKEIIKNIDEEFDRFWDSIIQLDENLLY